MVELKSYGLQSDQGPHLNLNEDLAEVDLINKLFILIDGFGGSNIGDRAAQIIRDSVSRSFTKISVDPEATLPFFYNHKYLLEGNALLNAFYMAHQNMSRYNEQKNISNKGGGSIVSGAISENVLTLVSTGNCTTYLYRKGRLTIEVLPDSLANVSRGFSEKNSSIPMSGIGMFEDLSYTVRELKLAEGDMVIMLTDGVHARIDVEELKTIIEKNIEGESNAIKELFKLANERGNLDNQSAIILQF